MEHIVIRSSPDQLLKLTELAVDDFAGRKNIPRGMAAPAARTVLKATLTGEHLCPGLTKD